MKKRFSIWTTGLLCLAVIAGSTPPALAFSDVTEASTSLAVETLSGLGVVSGGGNDSYYPNEMLTRAQFSKLAILVEGHGNQVSSSAYKTLFSDVPGSSWAAPYVNLAYSEKLVSGYGDGTFGPDDPVTTAQAVTIVLHLLGYSNGDIGPFWPEDYMSKATNLGLLDGVNQTAEAALTRGEAAVLLSHLLNTNTSQEKPFYQGLAASSVTGSTLLDIDATAADGTEHTAMVYANNAITYYRQTTTLPAALVGQRGVLLLDSAGKAMGFLPDDGVEKTVTVSHVDSAELNGIALRSNVPVLFDGECGTYETCWYELRSGDEAVLYYNSAGTVELLWVKDRTAGGGSTLTGYYEDASPNTTAPSTITVLGAALSVTDAGCTALKTYAIGDKITVTLDASGKVSAVTGASAADAPVVGLLKAASSTKIEVELLSGLTVSGTPYTTAPSSLTGGLVKVSAQASGKVTLSALSYTPSTVALEQLERADAIKIYEQINGSTLTELDWEDISAASVPASSILHVGTNASGQAELVVLENVTGSCYSYGILNVGEQQGGTGEMTYANTTVSVENSKGTGTAYVTGLSIQDGAVGGVAGTSGGKAASVLTLSAKSGLTRADFDGTTSLGGMALADDVQVYNSVTEKWTTLSAARAFTDSFTAYYDTHGVVRVLFAQ